jgi:hypothetical protein
MTELTVYADFNNADPAGRVRLHVRGTVDDLKTFSIELCEGLELTLSDGELRVRGIVRFSTDEQIWVAEVNWNDIVDVV